MARPKLSPEFRIVEGTHRNDRHGDRDSVELVDVLEEMPLPPRDGVEFNKRWNDYCQLLIDAGVLIPRDLPCVEMLCVAHEMMKNAEDEIVKSGQYQANARGGRVANPAMLRREAALRQILKYQSQLGLTPSTRASLVPLQWKAFVAKYLVAE